MARVILITGGNLGDVERSLIRAREMIGQQIGEVTGASPVMESRSWGFVSAECFLNQVLTVETRLDPLAVLDELQQIEVKLGRIRPPKGEHSETNAEGQRYISRTMDIDILFYDDMVLDAPRLTLPHPLIQEREFVLAPLCTILPDLKHPRLGRSMSELREQLHQDLPAEPYSVFHAVKYAGAKKTKTT